MPPIVGDYAKQTPQTTYGATKAICELLVNDYTRKGFFDGRSARLPTVIVRHGKPNAAASSFVSGLFREPLNGESCTIPVSEDTVMPVLGYRSEEHTSELPSLMRNSYAVFCLKKKNTQRRNILKHTRSCSTQ